MIDLHAHSNRSDGTLEPVELVSRAVGLGLNALAITDHDTLAGYDDVVCGPITSNIVLVCGVELTTHYENRTIHLLCYFLHGDPSSRFRKWLCRLQDVRKARNLRIVEKLLAHGCELTFGDSQPNRVIGRPHIARQLVARGYASSIADAFVRYIGESAPCYEKGATPEIGDAIEAALSAYGVPVLAHPGRYAMQDSIFESALQKMIAMGLQGIEVLHSEHTTQQTAHYRTLALRYRLAMTGGSDFHGETKPLIHLGRGIDANLCVEDDILSVLYRDYGDPVVRRIRGVSAIVTTLSPTALHSNVVIRAQCKEFLAQVSELRTRLYGPGLPSVCAGETVVVEFRVEDIEAVSKIRASTEVAIIDSLSNVTAVGIAIGPAFERNGVVVWFTGLSGAGKSTIARAVAAKLEGCGTPAAVLDGDAVRRHLSCGLGYSRSDRDENIRRIAFAASVLERQGLVVLVSMISPYSAGRERARLEARNFIEVYVNAPLEVCESRDVKGLYRLARAGEIRHFTGITAIYEPPSKPDVACQTDIESIEESTHKVLQKLFTKLL